MVWAPLRKAIGVLLIIIGIVTYLTPLPISNLSIATGLILIMGKERFIALKEDYKLWRAKRKQSKRGTKSPASTVPIGARAGLQLQTS